MNHKIHLLFVFFMTCTIATIAQSKIESESTSDKRFYIKAYGGYGAFTPGSYRVETRTTYPYSVGSTTRDTTISSLGKKGMGAGPHFGGGLGYIINNFLNVGVDVDYLKGNTLTGNKSYLSSSSSATYQYQQQSYGKSTLDYHVLTIVPHVLFKARSSANYYIYNRLGLMLSLPFDLTYKSYDSTITNSVSTYTNSPVAGQTTTSTYRSKSIRTTSGTYKVPLSYGLNVALGTQFRITGNLRGFVEAFANFSVLVPTNYDEVIYTESNSTTNPIVKNSSGTTMSNTTTGTISQTTATSNYTYSKEGGISSATSKQMYAPGAATVIGGVTYTKYVNSYTITQTQSNIYRNMNAIGLNAGLAYRF